jgi:hypothetical protein
VVLHVLTIVTQVPVNHVGIVYESNGKEYGLEAVLAVDGRVDVWMLQRFERLRVLAGGHSAVEVVLTQGDHPSIMNGSANMKAAK